MPKLIRKVDSLQLQLPESPEEYSTTSGAAFKIGKDGLVTFTKTTGCLGCDLCWPIHEFNGKPGHLVNEAGDFVLCTKDNPHSTPTVQ